MRLRPGEVGASGVLGLPDTLRVVSPAPSFSSVAGAHGHRTVAHGGRPLTGTSRSYTVRTVGKAEATKGVTAPTEVAARGLEEVPAFRTYLIEVA